MVKKIICNYLKKINCKHSIFKVRYLSSNGVDDELPYFLISFKRENKACKNNTSTDSSLNSASIGVHKYEFFKTKNSP